MNTEQASENIFTYINNLSNAKNLLHILSNNTIQYYHILLLRTLVTIHWYQPTTLSCYITDMKSSYHQLIKGLRKDFEF